MITSITQRAAFLAATALVSLTLLTGCERKPTNTPIQPETSATTPALPSLPASDAMGTASASAPAFPASDAMGSNSSSASSPLPASAASQ